MRTPANRIEFNVSLLLYPSLILRGIFLVLHGLAIVSLFYSFSLYVELLNPGDAYTSLAALCLSCALIGVLISGRNHWQKLSMAPVSAVYFNNGNWRLLIGSHWYSVELDGTQLLWQWLQILRFKRDTGEIYQVVILSDSAGEETENLDELRKLRVLLFR